MRRVTLATLAAITLILGLIVLWGSSDVQAQTTPSPSTWGAVKAMYGESQPSQVSSSTPNDQAARDESAPEPWSLPAARAVIKKYGIMPNEILAVERVVAYNAGVPSDSAEAVVTNRLWYYVSLTDGMVYNVEPPKFQLATERDILGSGVEKIQSGICGGSGKYADEWVVTFYMPTCFHEIGATGQFTEITDAWAQNPYCSVWCNGGACTWFQCGYAWEGPGYMGWWNFNDCGNRISRKLGKQVQKRWLYTYRGSCYKMSDAQIAGYVRAHIRY